MLCLLACLAMYAHTLAEGYLVTSADPVHEDSRPTSRLVCSAVGHNSLIVRPSSNRHCFVAENKDDKAPSPTRDRERHYIA